ncbi:MAG: TolC family protein [Magnetococcales bacterium]|nr:TolC family protein [Magnetococcales bacterium]
MKRSPRSRFFPKYLFLAALLTAGCVVTPQTLTVGEMETSRKVDLERMFGPVARIEKPLSLPEVIARALRYNLDHRVKVVEEAQALDLTKLDKFELLPKLAAGSAYSGRSNDSASSSRSMLTGNQSLEVSTSQDREHITSDLDLSWNILDFGVSYFNARQNADRQLIARERERKVIQNLIQEARSAYWRVVAAQQLKPRVAAIIQQAETALEDAHKAEKSALKAPLDFLRYRKTLLESMRQLESILQEMATAKVELAAMITLPPGTDYTLEVPDDPRQTPTWTMPLETMEESALINQPDMREMAYQGRIVVDETRKSLLKLFPGISLSASRKRDDNSYTLNKDWYETGLRVTWNLMNLLSAPDRWAYDKSNEEVLKIKRLALRMALLSQVHIAHHQYEIATTQLKRAQALFEVEKEIARHMRNREAQESQSLIDRIASDTSAVLAELRYYHALALTHGAVGRMMATTGQDPNVGSIQEGTLSDLTRRVDAWLVRQAFDGQSSPDRPKSDRVGNPTHPKSDSQSLKRLPHDATSKSPAPEVAAKGNKSFSSTSGTGSSVPSNSGIVHTRAHVRSGPGHHYRRIRSLNSNQPVVIQDSSPDGAWLRIGDGAWIAASVVTRTP